MHPVMPYLSLFYLSPLILLPFSPFYSYILCVFVMVGFSPYIPKTYRFILSFNLIFTIALLYASRLYFNLTPDYDDDFSRYYQNYLDVYDNIPNAMFAWGRELGLPLFYKLLALTLPRLTPQYVLFFTAFATTLLLYIWLEKYGKRFVKQEQYAALIAFSLFVVMIIETLGVTRQCFASLFLLFGFFARAWYWRILFFVIAFSFHQSSLFVIAGAYFFYYFPRVGLMLFFAFLAAFIVSSVLVNTHIRELASLLNGVFPNQMAGYILTYINKNGYDLLIPPDIIKAILMLSVCVVMYVLNPHDKLTRKFRALILVCFIVYITHIVPVRIVILVSHICFYFILFVVLRRFFKLALLFFFPYFLRLMYSLLIAGDSADTRAFELFFSYPESGLYPFYYFFQGALQ